MRKLAISNGFIVIFIITLGKVFGLVRDALIASHFGLSRQNDIYMFALGNTMLLVSISYGITNAFIPIYSSILNKKSKKENNVFVNNLITIIFFISLVLVLLGIGLSKYLVVIFAPSIAKDANLIHQSISLIRVMFVSIIFVGVQSVVSGVLQSHNEILEVSSGPIISNSASIIYLLLFVNFYDLIGFGFFTTLGFALMLGILLPKYKKLGYKYSFVFDLKDKNILEIFKNLVPIVFSSSLAQINIFVLRYHAGRLNQGAISSLEYANKMNMLIYEIIGQAVTLVIYPVLTRYSFKDKYDRFNIELGKAVKFTLLLVLPAAAALYVLSVPLIKLYLMRGKFGYSEVLIISSILQFYLPTMIFYSIRDIISRAIFAVNKPHKAMMNSIMCIMLNFIIALFTVNIMGVKGLALSNSIAVSVSTVVFYYQLKSETKISMGKTVFVNTVKIVAASAIIVLIFIALKATIDSALLLLVSCFIIGVPLYFLIVYLLRFDSLKI